MSDLIEKVGGIEKAREIVAGAPDGSVGFGGEDGDCDYFRGNEYFDSDYELWMEVYFEMPLINKIDDLRTAIAEHDAPKFRVGDAIVYVDSFMHDEIGIVSKVDDRVWFNRGAAVCEFDMVRHATPSEIKSGKRES